MHIYINGNRRHSLQKIQNMKKVSRWDKLWLKTAESNFEYEKLQNNENKGMLVPVHFQPHTSPKLSPFCSETRTLTRIFLIGSILQTWHGAFANVNLSLWLR